MTHCQSPGAGPVAIWIARVGETVSARDMAAAMLVRMAQDLAGVRARLARDSQGRPRLEGCVDPPHVSISHHREYLATALTRLGPIGVDIETLRDVPAIDLAERWFDGDESAWLRGLPDDRRSLAFLQLWTRKEAVGKALGLGLRGGGMRRRVGQPDAGVITLEPAADTPEIAIVDMLKPPLIVAVACAGADAPGRTVQICWEAPSR